MTRTLNLVGMLFVIVLGGGLYQLKHIVEEKDRALDDLYRTHVANQKAVRVLGAEWAYLNSPEYLQELAVRHLRLAPTLPTQVIDDLDDIPYRAGGSALPEGSITPRYPIPKVKPVPGRPLRNGDLRNLPEDSDGVLVPASYASPDGGEQ